MASTHARFGSLEHGTTPGARCHARRSRATVAFAAIVAVSMLSSGRASAQAISYTVTESRCDAPRDVVTTRGEVLAFNLSADRPNDTTDILYNLTMKGGGRTCGTGLDGSFGDRWRNPPPQSVVFVVLTFPDGEIFVDSGDPVATGGGFGAGAVQRVGDSHVMLPMTAGVVLPDDWSAYQADLGAGPETFPRATATGVEIAFAPVLDVNDTLVSFCNVGGALPNPGTGLGLVIGYLVWRLEDPSPTPGPAPPESDFFALGEPIDFVPAVGPSDPGASLSRMVELDGVPLSGDEAFVYHDAPNTPDGSARANGTAPRGGTAYWYAVQPVIDGTPAAWGAVTLCGSAEGDRRMDLDGDTIYDAVDLDLDGSPEFISPHADWGLPGLGLTNGGVPLLSHGIHWVTPAESCEGGVTTLRVERITPPLSASVVLSMRWLDVVGATRYELHAGDLDVLRRGTEVEVALRELLACDLAAAPFTWATALIDDSGSRGRDRYYLMVAACSGGHDYGTDSFGTLRVPTTATCP